MKLLETMVAYTPSGTACARRSSTRRFSPSMSTAPPYVGSDPTPSKAGQEGTMGFMTKLGATALFITASLAGAADAARTTYTLKFIETPSKFIVQALVDAANEFKECATIDGA